LNGRSSNDAPELILAFDYGTRRIGIATGDTLTRTARGLKTLDNGPQLPWDAIAALIRDYSPAKLLVGLPYNMDGSETTLAAVIRQFARDLERRFSLPVTLIDERQSSREAERQLRDARAAGLKRKRVTHGDVDMTAAKVLLERWLCEGAVNSD
jgi:putative Holliday junction resolvase